MYIENSSNNYENKKLKEEIFNLNQKINDITFKNNNYKTILSNNRNYNSSNSFLFEKSNCCAISTATSTISNSNNSNIDSDEENKKFIKINYYKIPKLSEKKMNDELKIIGYNYDELKLNSKHKKKQLINKNNNKKFGRLFN